MFMNRFLFCVLALTTINCIAETHTWDGAHDTSNIEVTVVYFVPSDRAPLPDWRERVDYYCKRIEQFHAREFQGQSTLRTLVRSEPLVSEFDTAQLRVGDANAIYYRTLNEADRRLKFAPVGVTGKDERQAFPILLVLSEINWRPLDDFFRLKPSEGGLVFEGNYNRGQHFPGAASGGARALYNPRRGIGWGLVSADGWRVPYRGSDCVVYHEGCGHTVGLPHPEPGNGSVMSMGQYRGWISESSLDKEQKTRLGWSPESVESNVQTNLFSEFRAIPEPLIPKPGQLVRLKLDWPDGVQVASLRIRVQTSVVGPWVEVPQMWDGPAPEFADLGMFDRPTPISYRVDAKLMTGEAAEIWGYMQVRADKNQTPQPPPSGSSSLDLLPRQSAGSQTVVSEISVGGIDLLALSNPTTDNRKELWSRGDWQWSEGRLESPKMFGASLQLPYSPPAEYRLTLVIEPLDEPNGLLVGNLVSGNRFVSLFSYKMPDGFASAIENVDGKNVGNETTFKGSVFRKGQLSQVIVTVRNGLVSMSVDGKLIVNWRGKDDRLSLSEYWVTPDSTAMFLGAYDCRYRFYRVTLEPISGEGRHLVP